MIGVRYFSWGRFGFDVMVASHRRSGLVYMTMIVVNGVRGNLLRAVVDGSLWSLVLVPLPVEAAADGTNAPGIAHGDLPGEVTLGKWIVEWLIFVNVVGGVVVVVVHG
jgi:hypothetical protein